MSRLLSGKVLARSPPADAHVTDAGAMGQSDGSQTAPAPTASPRGGIYTAAYETRDSTQFHLFYMGKNNPMEKGRFNGAGLMALRSYFVASTLRNEEPTNPADLTEDFQHYT